MSGLWHHRWLATAMSHFSDLLAPSTWHQSPWIWVLLFLDPSWGLSVLSEWGRIVCLVLLYYKIFSLGKGLKVKERKLLSPPFGAWGILTSVKAGTRQINISHLNHNHMFLLFVVVISLLFSLLLSFFVSFQLTFYHLILNLLNIYLLSIHPVICLTSTHVGHLICHYFPYYLLDLIDISINHPQCTHSRSDTKLQTR